MRILSATALAAALSLGAVATATAEPWDLDKSHTAVTFTVDHLGYSLTHGFFTEFDAKIDYDAENPEASSVVFTIDAASVNTLWAKRDEHVRNKDFLDVENHPEIVFTSKSIDMTGDDTARLVGDLTILGQTHEETFDVTMRKTAPSPFDKSKIVAGFNAKAVIDRTKYGISYAAPVVGTEIPVSVELEIFKKK